MQSSGCRSAAPVMRWRCGSFVFDMSRPLVMGILNVTPDSFSDGGTHNVFEDAISHAEKMRDAGAAIIDVGGESTRPGSLEVSLEEEIGRTVEVVRALAERGMCVSIDTRHAAVAAACVEAGAAIINDVSGFRDPAMVQIAANTDAGCVVMHMAGEPKTMQAAPHYEDVVHEVRDYLCAQSAMLEKAGVARERICIDPGPGFGKTTEHNIALIEASHELATCGYPLIVATSRKRFVGELYGVEIPAKRVWSSVATALWAVCGGARIIRAHDVAQTVAALNALEGAPHRAYIALGSNVGDRLAHLQEAVDEIGGLCETRVVACSSVYESEPAYFEDQQTFANAVLQVETRLLPEVLLAELQRLELGQGRVRTFRNAPRPLDLDILDYEGVVCDTELLTLPHPGISERDFVVTPFLELTASLSDFALANGASITRDKIAYGEVLGILGRLEYVGETGMRDE